MANKITYLLNRWKSCEWSGPAWYSFKVNKNGFPDSFKLEYFALLDKGSASSTEWEGKDFAKIMPKIINRYPKLKKAVVGNIHSHHSMGAFFSGTDEELLNQNAAKSFYPSLVVASSKNPFAFAISYLDQYNQPHIIESDEDDIIIDIPSPRDEWIKEADKVEKASKKSYSQGLWGSQKYTPGKGGSLQQQTMFLEGRENSGLAKNKGNDKEKWKDEIDEYNQGFYYSDNPLDEYNEIIEAVDRGQLDTIEANRLLSELNLDWEGKPLD